MVVVVAIVVDVDVVDGGLLQKRRGRRKIGMNVLVREHEVGLEAERFHVRIGCLKSCMQGERKEISEQHVH